MGRYSNITTLQLPKGKRYLRDVKYPEIPLDVTDVYITVTSEDRYDILANTYYKDPSLWWVIQIANPNQPQDSYYPIGGSQIRIPTNISRVRTLFNKINQ